VAGRGEQAFDRWRRVDQIFDQALDLAPKDREAFVREASQVDPELAGEVLALLSTSDELGDFLTDPSFELPPELLEEVPGSNTDQDHTSCERIGPYRLLDVIGRGGMSTVYLAERESARFQQQLALKVLRKGLDTEDIVARFLAERQILASLSHPHIGGLVDGGATEDGRPYFVMEYVDGRSLTEYAEANHLPLEERLRLFLTVVETVEYAHRNLVIHRDLKPSNILVTDDGVVKLLDFGIAKLLDTSEIPTDAPLTRHGQHFLTPEYASPEQSAGRAVTTASDVYQLGVLLSELVSEGRTATGIRDLDAIIGQALRDDPVLRYGTAAALGEDIGRFLNGKPVAARGESFTYVTGRLIARHRVSTAALGAFLVWLVVSGFVLLVQRNHAREARGEAEQKAETARQVTAFLSQVFGGSDPSVTLGDTVTARELLDRGAERVEDELADQPEVQAELLGVMGEVYSSLGSYERALPLLERSVELRRGGAGDAGDLAHSLLRLATSTRVQGDYATSEPHYREALRIFREIEGERSSVARVHSGLAMSLRELGKADSAEVHMREALRLFAETQGQKAPEYIGTLQQLAYVLRAKGELTEAEELYRKVLGEQRVILDPSDPDLAATLNNLAYVRRLQEDYEEAASYYREALGILTEVFGRGHPTTLQVAWNLTTTLGLSGDRDAAIALDQESVRAAEERWPDGHWRLGHAYGSLGVSYLFASRPQEALDPLRNGVRTYAGTIGQWHSWTMVGLGWYAAALHLSGRFDEAVGEFNTSLVGLSSYEGLSGDENVLPRIEGLADFLERSGLQDRAFQYQQFLNGSSPAGDAP